MVALASSWEVVTLDSASAVLMALVVLAFGVVSVEFQWC